MGDDVSGPRIITEKAKKEMKKVLAETQSGEFVKKWMADNRMVDTTRN
jgi:ketol-acid reductoisomerase